MYGELESLMRQNGVDKAKLEKTKEFWEGNFKNKKIIRYRTHLLNYLLTYSLTYLLHYLLTHLLTYLLTIYTLVSL